ncbi:MAG: PGPGW domain-containing protein [Acidobacteriaceae bacterium]|jgi:uncharacterized protein YqgC (DUF456 family)|nr:PGPGW domain-containing protein [Acidobacteriaceae bacterium]
MSRHTYNPSLWRKTVGWSCLVVGALGLVLPIIPGIPLLVIGLAALSTQHRWARALFAWAKKRYRRLLAKAKAGAGKVRGVR